MLADHPPRRLAALVLVLLLIAPGAPIAAADDAPAAAASSPPSTMPAGEPLVTVIPGDLPIILSAPHGGREPVEGAPPRTGENARRFVTLRDTNTAELAEALAKEIQRELGARPHVIIARFDRKFVDANRAPRDAYEHELARRQYGAYHGAIRAAAAAVRDRWGRGLLLDLHGQSASRDAIYRGTRNGLTTTALLRRAGAEALVGPDSVMGHLAARGYTVLPELPPNAGADADAEIGEGDGDAAAVDETLRRAIGHESRFNGGHIVDDHGSHRGAAVDAIQLEFGSNLRRKDRLEQTARDTASAVAAFARKYLPAVEPAP